MDSRSCIIYPDLCQLEIHQNAWQNGIFNARIIRHEDLKHEDYKWNLRRNHDMFLDVKKTGEK